MDWMDVLIGQREGDADVGVSRRSVAGTIMFVIVALVLLGALVAGTYAVAQVLKGAVEHVDDGDRP